ncbi:MAG: transporter substrate-binding domain-containing protein [Eubacteriales bacterium]|nr:transporter substrate-binding domain-containing protein [Eubacteriales bacterium]
MKKILALCVALTLVLTASFALADTLKMGTNASFPPYEYVEGDAVVGIDAEIAAAVCEKMGYELEIVDMDFGGIVSAVQTGKIDFGMAGMTVTEERLQTVNFSDSYATGIQSVIVKADSDITSVDDLLADGANHKVGVQESTTGDIYTSGDIEEAGKGTVSRFQTGNDAVMALVSGKIDCVVIDNAPAKAFVEANEGLKLLDTEYAVEDYAACFSKEKTELLESFNTALNELIADGTVQAIIEKYIPVEAE